MPRHAYVYMLSNRTRGVLYVGITSDLVKRVWEHKEHLVRGFTQRYGIIRLVYFEATEDIASAIEREKHLKRWRRAWKIQLVEGFNPEWRDLYWELVA